MHQGTDAPRDALRDGHAKGWTHKGMRQGTDTPRDGHAKGRMHQGTDTPRDIRAEGRTRRGTDAPRDGHMATFAGYGAGRQRRTLTRNPPSGRQSSEGRCREPGRSRAGGRNPRRKGARGRSTARTRGPLTPAPTRAPSLGGHGYTGSRAAPRASFNCHYYYYNYAGS